MEFKGKTLKEMCDVISESGILSKDDGSFLTSVEIANYDSHGGLMHITEWYQKALYVLYDKRPDTIKKLNVHICEGLLFESSDADMCLKCGTIFNGDNTFIMFEEVD